MLNEAADPEEGSEEIESGTSMRRIAQIVAFSNPKCTRAYKLTFSEACVQFATSVVNGCKSEGPREPSQWLINNRLREGIVTGEKARRLRGCMYKYVNLLTASHAKEDVERISLVEAGLMSDIHVLFCTLNGYHLSDCVEGGGL